MNQVYMLALLNGVLFVFIVMFFYHFFRFSHDKNLIRNSAEYMVNKSQESESKRKRKEDELLLREGIQDKKSFMYSLDRMLLQGGIKKMVPWLNAEVYLTLGILAGTVVMFVVYYLSNMLIFSLLGLSLVFVVFYLILYLASGMANKKIEDNITIFINLLNNYSQLSDDVVQIIGSTRNSINEPLKSIVSDFYDDCHNNGDIDESYNRMLHKIEHEKLKEILRSIQICSHYDANYAVIIKENKKSLKSYLREKEERKSIIQNGRIEIMLLYFAILGMVGVLCYTNAVPKETYVHLMLHTKIGMGILLYGIVLIVFSTTLLFSFDKRGG